MVLASAGSVETLSPVQYAADLRWRDQDIGPATAVVDFPFHPQALVWVDHHDTAFANESERATFRSNGLRAFDPQAPSCPAVIATLPWFPNAPHWNEYIHWANIIDSAQYPTAQSASDLSNPHVLFAHVIVEMADDTSLADVVRGIPRFPMSDVLRMRAVASTRDRVLRDDRKIRGELRSRLQLSNAVAVLDQSDLPIPYRRYLAFETYPTVSYGIGLYRNESGVIVSVGENPWTSAGPVHLGQLCHEYGGGGRRSVAGIPTPSPQIAHELAAALVERLNAELRNAQHTAEAG